MKIEQKHEWRPRVEKGKNREYRDAMNETETTSEEAALSADERKTSKKYSPLETNLSGETEINSWGKELVKQSTWLFWRGENSV